MSASGDSASAFAVKYVDVLLAVVEQDVLEELDGDDDDSECSLSPVGGFMDVDWELDEDDDDCEGSLPTVSCCHDIVFILDVESEGVDSVWTASRI